MDADDASMLEMMEGRLKRRANGEANDVEEEEMEQYPLFPVNSVMHYLSAPISEDDFPGYMERLDRWTKLSKDSLEATSHLANRKSPIVYHAQKLVNTVVITERHWMTQLQFMELVMAHPLDNVFGYWEMSGPKQRTLDTLATCSSFPVVLTYVPHPKIPFHVDYASMKYVKDAKKCALHRLVQSYRDKGHDVATVFMCDFQPIDVEYVRTFYPMARIVGITTPRPDTEAQIVQVLRTRPKLKDPATTDKEAFEMLRDILKQTDDVQDFLKAMQANTTLSEKAILEVARKVGADMQKDWIRNVQRTRERLNRDGDSSGSSGQNNNNNSK